MKLTIRKNKTFVALRKAYGLPATWVPNDRLWSQTLASVAPNATSGSVGEFLGGHRLLPGNVVAIGAKGLSLVFELPAGYRNIRVSNGKKYSIQQGDASVEDYEVWVPTMLVYVQYSAACRLGSMSVFFIKKTDVDFTSSAYYDQTHYLPPFPNQYSTGAFCLPDNHIIAPDKSLGSFVNTAVEAIFGTSFNYDMGGMPETLKKGSKLYDPTKHTDTLTALFKRWRKMTPAEVQKLSWKKAALSPERVRAAYNIPLSANPFTDNRRFHTLLEHEVARITRETSRSRR